MVTLTDLQQNLFRQPQQGGGLLDPNIFLQRRGSTAADMLGGLAAGLLGGRNFGEGLSQGLLNVQDVRRQGNLLDAQNQANAVNLAIQNRGFQAQQDQFQAQQAQQDIANQMAERRFGLEERGVKLAEEQARRIKTPSGKIIQLQGPDGQVMAIQQDDPRVSQLLGQGFMPTGGDLRFKDTQAARKEFTTQSKPFQTARDAFNRIDAVGTVENPTGADDMALIFNFMKVLDPGSTVREGEFATAENTGGVDDRVRNIYNKVLSGERLSPQQRSNFVSSASRLFERQEAQHTQRENIFRGLAKAQGLDPDQVVIDLGRATPATSAPPQDGPPQINQPQMQPGEQRTIGNVTIQRVD